MIERKLKICSVCEKPSILWRSSPKMCRQCAVKYANQSMIKHQNHVPQIKKTAIKKKFPKVSGQYALFLAIAKTRKHICFVTKERVDIYNPDGSLNVKCFAHVVSKGSRKDLVLLDKNIVIVTPRVHEIYDKGNAQERIEMEKYEGWHKLYELHDKILEENNRDNK